MCVQFQCVTGVTRSKSMETARWVFGNGLLTTSTSQFSLIQYLCICKCIGRTLLDQHMRTRHAARHTFDAHDCMCGIDGEAAVYLKFDAPICRYESSRVENKTNETKTKNKYSRNIVIKAMRVCAYAFNTARLHSTRPYTHIRSVAHQSPVASHQWTVW